MTMSMTPDDVQLDERQLSALLHSQSGPVGALLLRVGKKVEGLAKRKAPVDTGRLRSSITTGLFTIPYDPYLACRVGSDVEYAPYVNDGTRYMAPRPFLTEALGEVTGDLA